MLAGALTLPLVGCGADAPAIADNRARLTIADDLGRAVTLPAPLRRTVVFNRYTTEFIRAIAGMGVVVGVDIDAAKSPAYWPTITPAMVVGQSQSSPNFEAIVALHPDVVFMPRNSDWQKAAAALAPFGIPVAIVTGWDVLKHEFNVTLLGRLYDRHAAAARLNAFYRGIRDTLATRLAGAARPAVYIEEVGDWKTLLPGSGWHDMVEAGGGRNVFGDIRILDQPKARGSVQGFEVDPEEVLARRPEVIIKLQPGQYEPHTTAFSRGILDGIAARPGFATLPAVARGEVYHLSYYLASACSKIVGALQIAHWLHPARMRGTDPDAAMRNWLREFQGVAYPGGYWTSLKALR